MRTIDADALQEDFIKRCYGECDNCKYGKNEKSWDGCRLIDLAPTVEQPTGEWIYIGQHKGLKVVECTNCHKRQYGSMNYCGNCGAKMRKGEEE